MTYHYQIHIWEHCTDQPEPATFAAAGQTLQALQATRAPANTKFVSLVQKLLKHYPSQACNPNRLRSAWGGDPFRDALMADKKLFSLRLPPANRVELLRLVVESAMALGLAVFDHQIAMVFLPSGRVLPQERADSWVRIKEQMDSEVL